jgi:hypothetical protein
MSARSRFAVTVLSLAFSAGCEKPNQYDPNTDSVRLDAGRDAGGGLPQDGPGTPNLGDGPAVATADGPAQDPSCPVGQHTCGGACVDNESPMHCGSLCTPCETIQGGTPACDGTKCSVTCPDGKKPCLDACIDANAVCDGACPPGKNPCGGICVDAKSLTACGPGCLPCPTSPSGQSSCDGEKCLLTCNPGFHRCGDACVSDGDVKTCGVSCSPCQPPIGGTATCDGTRCGGECPSGTKLCAGACIPANQACMGQCPAGRHDCSGNCVADNDVNSCGSSCNPCPVPAGAQATCNGGRCDFTCPSKRKCGDQCVANSQLCEGTCGEGYRVCGSGCVATSAVTAEICDGRDNDCDGQTDEDLTQDCSTACGSGSRRCVNGRWDESSCPKKPTDSDTMACGSMCEVCRSYPNATPVCRSGQCDFTCKSGTVKAPTGCIACGGDQQPCCSGGSCNAGQVCDNTFVAMPICVPCGRAGYHCCSGSKCDPGFVCAQSSPERGSFCYDCGDDRQPCCDGYRCNGGLNCLAVGNTGVGAKGKCENDNCGLRGQRCCAPSRCSDGSSCGEVVVDGVTLLMCQ